MFARITKQQLQAKDGCSDFFELDLRENIFYFLPSRYATILSLHDYCTDIYQ